MLYGDMKGCQHFRRKPPNIDGNYDVCLPFDRSSQNVGVFLEALYCGHKTLVPRHFCILYRLIHHVDPTIKSFDGYVRFPTCDTTNGLFKDLSAPKCSEHALLRKANQKVTQHHWMQDIGIQ